MSDRDKLLDRVIEELESLDRWNPATCFIVDGYIEDGSEYLSFDGENVKWKDIAAVIDNLKRLRINANKK